MLKLRVITKESKQLSNHAAHYKAFANVRKFSAPLRENMVKLFKIKAI